jgi:hypothetical protein
MLGVLLAAARPGQRAPGLGQAVNLAACGLVIRVRRIPGWLAADAGQDALAVVSLIAPAVVVILLALGRGAMDATAAARVPFWTLLPVLPSLGESVVVLAWLAVVLLGLTGCRGAAAVIAAISLTLAWLAVLTASVQQSGDLSQGLFQFLGTVDVPVVLASLAACSLAFSAGPRRGLAIAGRRQAWLMIAVLSVGSGVPALFDLVSPYVLVAGPAYSLLSALAIAVALAVTRVRGLTSGWVTVLLAIGFLVDLDPFTGTMTADVVLLLLALLVWPVAIASWKGRPPAGIAGVSR